MKKHIITYDKEFVHTEVESVTLWNDDVPTTLTVQEYRDSI